MSFDEVRLPLRVAFGASGGVAFNTEVVAVGSGFEKRNQRWSQARRRYDAGTGVASANEASLLVAFFQARFGRARGFRLKDWTDFSSAADGKETALWDDQIIGEGDGSRASYQLVKKYGAHDVFYERVIRKPVEGSVRVGVGGVEYETGWSVDTTTGIVSFAQAPASGSIITAGFEFDVPVRFDTDVLNRISVDGNLARIEAPLIEIRVS